MLTVLNPFFIDVPWIDRGLALIGSGRFYIGIHRNELGRTYDNEKSSGHRKYKATYFTKSTYTG